MEFQTSSSRRQFLSAVAMTTGAAMMLRSGLGWAADMTDPRVADIVGKTIGIDTHNHIDVPLTAAEMPGPDIDLSGEMKRSGLSVQFPRLESKAEQAYSGCRASQRRTGHYVANERSVRIGYHSIRNLKN